jgi:hypothetical protein
MSLFKTTVYRLYHQTFYTVLQTHMQMHTLYTAQVKSEQHIEWSSQLYTVFIDSEKAFDSINREAMWKEVKHYGVPTQIINLIKETYWGYACPVVHEG